MGRARLMACPMCSGTDCAGACDQGQCYAEEYERQHQAEENARYEAEQAAEYERQARRCESNLTDQPGNCVWCSAANGQACLDPRMVSCECGADVDSSIRGECDDCGRLAV